MMITMLMMIDIDDDDDIDDLLPATTVSSLFCFNRFTSRRLFYSVSLVREDYDVGSVYHGVCKKFHQEIL